jgi:kynurenine 3-monooxygenase
MCDLALFNYEEMRSSVTKPGYKLRKFVMGVVHYLFPKTVIPLYTMVSFTRIPYGEVVKRWKRQGLWFGVFGWGGIGAVGAGLAVIGLRFLRK